MNKQQEPEVIDLTGFDDWTHYEMYNVWRELLLNGAFNECDHVFAKVTMKAYLRICDFIGTGDKGFFCNGKGIVFLTDAQHKLRSHQEVCDKTIFEAHQRRKQSSVDAEKKLTQLEKLVDQVRPFWKF